MDKDKAMELDKMVFEWWHNTDGVSLTDIFRHFDAKSVFGPSGECRENFKKLLYDKYFKKGEG